MTKNVCDSINLPFTKQLQGEVLVKSLTAEPHSGFPFPKHPEEKQLQKLPLSGNPLVRMGRDF